MITGVYRHFATTLARNKKKVNYLFSSCSFHYEDCACAEEKGMYMWSCCGSLERYSFCDPNRDKNNLSPRPTPHFSLTYMHGTFPNTLTEEQISRLELRRTKEEDKIKMRTTIKDLEDRKACTMRKLSSSTKLTPRGSKAPKDQRQKPMNGEDMRSSRRMSSGPPSTLSFGRSKSDVKPTTSNPRFMSLSQILSK